MRFRTGSMLVTVWPYTFSNGWLPPPIQMGGGGRWAGLGSMGGFLNWEYFPSYVTLSPGPRAGPPQRPPGLEPRAGVRRRREQQVVDADGTVKAEILGPPEVGAHLVERGRLRAESEAGEA